MFEFPADPSSLVGVIESTHRQESTLVARRLAAVAALLRHRVALAEQPDREYAEIDGFEQTAAEVAAAMNLSPMGASYLVSYAEALDVRLPKIAALLTEGRTDWRTVRLVISRTDLVTDETLIANLDHSLAERIGNWHGWSRQRIVNAVDAAVRTADPDAARERRRAAEDERCIGIRAAADGMAEVHGSVAASAAVAFDRRLSQLAKQVCPADPRTMDQRRADALGALAEGRGLGCACGQAECPVRLGEGDDGRAGVRVVINVVASERTVHDNGSEPGYLEGYGVIDAEQVRQLAGAAAVLVADPVTSPVEALRYQPSAALERTVRCRDLTCRFPGCSRPAVVCDLDHTVPFNHRDPAAGGQTTAENLKCLCRQHHRLKTFGGWRDNQLPDGTVVWTSPSGRTYRTSPAGADLFPPPRGPACVTPAPKRRSRLQHRSARIARARGHNREQRPINEARMRLEWGRKEEIASRKFRNHMRDMLFLFKGAPSTSPYCTWVNDPREPEELPPDWQPDELVLQPLPDDPPF
ncbi:HNH nuclease [Mycobacterium sp. 852002-51971_SCH5477799-a]|uniref:HNH endonuclease signature motif containing protein n=1 Tax=Mycobacterium sp. 852002-51971_SCH5477799-a TaxID=1834106 RepID=UPI0007FD6CB0|nr:HNH endonuclease signature motif containing protein [Mycobacterium sp. 852002-51971_SCH5477799-a]OBF61039.1 HNH nuclease [Mycobacterium sp. 852002-51971_SCH5477799-a]